MPKRTDTREYRSAPMFAAEQGETENDYTIRGYASTFGEKYRVFDWELGEIWEVMDPHAFDEADMSDVVLQIDHEGRVYARSRNKGIAVGVDEHGLLVTGDLHTTTNQRELWEDIKAGNYDRMSFGFTIAEGGRTYDRATNTQTITKVAKLYDVSVVSFPANEGTEISARSRDFISGARKKSEEEHLEEQRRKAQLIKAKMKLGGIYHEGH